jgi:O-antigen ligase
MNVSSLGKKFSTEFASAENLLVLSLALFPVFSLSVHRWISACLFISFGAAIYILIRDKDRHLNFFSEQVSRVWLTALTIVLTAPVTAIMLGQIFRQEFIASAYDNASRFLLGVPIALVIVRKKINVLKLLEYTIPAGIFFAALGAHINPNLDFDAERVSTHFVDPLTFGSVCLTMALISLVSIDLNEPDKLWVRLYKLCGFAIGLYLAFLSGSRTGWIALPIVLWLWLRFRKNIPHWAIFVLVAAICAAVYFFVPLIHARVNIGMQEVLNYQWYEVNPDNSVGMRISFVRIGLFMFAHNPLGGWGDRGFEHLLSAPELQRFATEYTRNFAFQHGFHNELVTNMVRSGIWGLFSSLALFLVPLACFVKGLRSQSEVVRNHALVGVSYLICVLVSGMSTEVFNLKFTASFHALMIASLVASLIVLMSSHRNSNMP